MNKDFPKIFLCKKVMKPIVYKIAADSNKKKEFGREKAYEKKRFKLRNSGPFKNGRWNLVEHESFIKSVIAFGNNWKKVMELFIVR